MWIRNFTVVVLCMALLKCTQPSSPNGNDNQYKVHLTGRVLDKDGKPMPNTIAKLIGKNLADTTDADGYYVIIEKATNSSLSKTNAIDMLDSLQIIKEGQVITMIDIAKWIDTLPDVFVVQRDIYGNFKSNPKSLSVIRAIITGDNISDSTPKIAALWYNGPNQSYSGFVYFVYTSQNLNYSVYVNVYNKDSIFIGRSVKVDFPSTAGDINLPAFNPNNAEPFVEAGNDTTVSINDTIKLHPTAVDSFAGNIIKWEWSINGGNFAQTSKGDTIIIAPVDSNPAYKCVFRATDNDNMVAFDSLKVIVCKDIPVANAGNDTTLHMNSQFTLHGKATQNFGKIVKWEWNIGGNGFSVAETSDTTLTTPCDLKKMNYPCILRITDDDDNIAYDTVILNLGIWESIGKKYFSDADAVCPTLAVWNDTPYVSFMDGSIGQKLTVMKYNGNSWVLVGNKGISDGFAGSPTLFISNGTLYVAYSDEAKGFKATVLRYVGSSWSPVGLKGFSDTVIAGNSLFVWNDTPFVAVESLESTTVYKYNGSQWEVIGQPTFGRGRLQKQSLCIWNGIPFVGCLDSNNAENVFKLVSSQWIPVSPNGFSQNWINDLSLIINEGIPYVAYTNHPDLGNKANVIKLNGNQWGFIGTNDFSDGVALSLSFSMSEGISYIAYSDSVTNYKTTVMCFSGSEWLPIGKKGFSDANAFEQSLCISNNKMYVAYYDNFNNNKLTVMQFK